jgi:hypothetical protein
VDPFHPNSRPTEALFSFKRKRSASFSFRRSMDGNVPKSAYEIPSMMLDLPLPIDPISRFVPSRNSIEDSECDLQLVSWMDFIIDD